MKEYIKTLSDNEKVRQLLIETIGAILAKQNDLNLFIKINNSKIIHIRDWILSVIENNEKWKTPRVLTIDALNNTADKYFEKKNNKLQTIELDEQQEKLIADLGEYYVVQMLTPEALDNESKQMQHCIGHGHYDRKLNDINYQYLSLRDKFNKAHVTMEIFKKDVLQIQGKQNKVSEDKYLEVLLPWLLKNQYKNIPFSSLGFFVDNNQNLINLKYLEIKENVDYYQYKYDELNILESKSLYFSVYHFYNKTDKFLFDEQNLKYIINDKYYIYSQKNNIFINIKEISDDIKTKQEYLNVMQFLYDKFDSNIISNLPQLYVENGKVDYIKNVIMEYGKDYETIYNMYYNDGTTILLKKIFSDKYFKYLKYNFFFSDSKISDKKDYLILEYNKKEILILTTKQKELIDIRVNDKSFEEKMFAFNILKNIGYKFNYIDWNCYEDENNTIRTLSGISFNSMEKDIDYVEKEFNGLKIYFGKSKKYYAYMKKEYDLDSFDFNIDNKVYIKCDKDKNIYDIDFYEKFDNNDESFAYFTKLVNYLRVHNYKNIDTGFFSRIINKIDNKVYSYYDTIFPEEIQVENAINLSTFKNFAYIKKIIFEDKLIINNLNLDYFNFDFNKFICKKDIDLSGCSTENLPKNFVVNGNLILNNFCYLNASEKIHIKGDLIAKKLEVAKISNKLFVDGDLVLDDSFIKSIADEFEVKGNLSGLNLINLNELPKKFKINGKLSLTGIDIETLSSEIIVSKSFNLSSHKIKRLEGKIIVKDSLNIKNCKNLNFISNDFQCDTLFINKKQIKLIKEDMNFNFIQISKDINRKIYTKKEFFENYFKDETKFKFEK